MVPGRRVPIRASNCSQWFRPSEHSAITDLRLLTRPAPPLLGTPLLGSNCHWTKWRLGHLAESRSGGVLTRPAGGCTDKQTLFQKALRYGLTAKDTGHSLIQSDIEIGRLNICKYRRKYRRRSASASESAYPTVAQGSLHTFAAPHPGGAARPARCRSPGRAAPAGTCRRRASSSVVRFGGWLEPNQGLAVLGMSHCVYGGATCFNWGWMLRVVISSSITAVEEEDGGKEGSSGKVCL